VHTFDYEWPVELDPARRVGVLLLVSCAEDALTTTERDVAALLAAEPKAAYRESAVVHRAEDGRLFIQATTPLQFTIVGGAASAVGPLG